MDLTGKLGLIVGVANKRSISWAIAQAAAQAGARLALTYPNARLEENVRELAATLDGAVVLPCDVTSDEQVAALGASLDQAFGGLDFMSHGVAFAPVFGPVFGPPGPLRHSSYEPANPLLTDLVGCRLASR